MPLGHRTHQEPCQHAHSTVDSFVLPHRERVASCQGLQMPTITSHGSESAEPIERHLVTVPAAAPVVVRQWLSTSHTCPPSSTAVSYCIHPDPKAQGLVHYRRQRKLSTICGILRTISHLRSGRRRRHASSASRAYPGPSTRRAKRSCTYREVIRSTCRAP